MLTEKVINQLTTTDIYQSQTITMVISDSTQESLSTYFEKKNQTNFHTKLQYWLRVPPEISLQLFKNISDYEIETQFSYILNINRVHIQQKHINYSIKYIPNQSVKLVPISWQPCISGLFPHLIASGVLELKYTSHHINSNLSIERYHYFHKLINLLMDLFKFNKVQ